MPEQQQGHSKEVKKLGVHCGVQAVHKATGFAKSEMRERTMTTQAVMKDVDLDML